MRIDPRQPRRSFQDAAGSRSRGHSTADRIAPSPFRYDYLALHTLGADIGDLIVAASAVRTGARALDLGAATSPYRAWLEARGYQVETLDTDPDSGADHVGDAADTHLPDASYDLVLCTQVIEHVPDPGRVLHEIARILKPGGSLIASAPHVWFYHPHPGDYWRFTQEGILELSSRAGFDVRALHAQGGSALTLFQACNFLLYGVLGRAGAPLYLVFNAIGRLADGVVRNALFSHNFAWHAVLSGTPAADPATPVGDGASGRH